MSATATEREAGAVRVAGDLCASCGIAALDNITLEECDGCDLVKYCSDKKCCEDHRERHAEECKKRADELHDRKLFTQPDGCCRGECPICFLPMPHGNKKTTFYSCCSKKICNGCEYTHRISNKQNNCPFCREPVLSSGDEENDRRMMKRIEAGDPAAMQRMGTLCFKQGDYDAAVKYWTNAAELGDAEAHYHLGVAYGEGYGVEKDEEKEVYHLEIAAIGGEPDARYNLGWIEDENGRFERAVKHFIIAAKVGDIGSMKELWKHYSDENISKEDLEATLRAHQAALDAMKSPHRDAADHNKWK